VQTKANGFRKRLPLKRFDPNVAFTAPPSKRETGTRQGLTPVSGWGAATKNAPHLKEKDEERKNAFMDFQCAMLEFIFENNSHLSRNSVYDAMDEADVPLPLSKSTFYDWLAKFKERGYLDRMEGSGRIASIIDDEFIAVLTSVAENANYRATQTELAQRMTDEMGFKVCRSTVRRAMVQEEWVRQRQKTRPHLLEHHISHRLDWAAARRAERANWKKDKKIVVDIHVDEKWFYAFKTGAWLYLPPGVEPPILVCKSKRFIPR